MKKRFILCLVLLPLLSASAEEWPPGSAMHTMKLFSKKVVSKTETALMLVNKIDEKLKGNGYTYYIDGSLQTQHKAWLHYVNATCSIAGRMSGAGGSWPSVKALLCEKNMLDQRIFKLSNSLQCIKRQMKNKQDMHDIVKCLYQSYSITY